MILQVNSQECEFNETFSHEQLSFICLQFKLPNYERQRTFKDLTPEEQRTQQKKEGVAPPRFFQEREIVIASTSQLFSLTSWQKVTVVVTYQIYNDNT